MGCCCTRTTDKVALPYVEEESILKGKAEEYWRNFCEKDGFGPYKATCNWEVFLFRRDELSHYSLVFRDENGKCFCTDLLKKTSEGSILKEVTYNYRIINVEAINFAEYKQSHIGNISMSAEEIIHTGYVVLRDFGWYRALGNNCQTFCSEFAQALGCQEEFAPFAMNVMEIVSMSFESIEHVYYTFEASSSD
jgi:hypothetical protein